MGQHSTFAFCFQVRVLLFIQKTMMNYESTVLPCPKRAFSDVPEGVALKMFSGGKPPEPQESLKQVQTFYMISASLWITLSVYSN